MDTLVLFAVLILCRFLFNYLSRINKNNYKVRLLLILFAIAVGVIPIILIKEEILINSVSNILISGVSVIYFSILLSRIRKS